MRDSLAQPAGWRWALWFAILAGLAQACLVAVARYAGHRIVSIGADFVWMSIVADAMVFVLAALTLRLALGRRSQYRYRALLCALIFLVLIGPALLVPRLHALAAVALSAGAGVQLARLLDRRIDRFDLVVRRTFWPIVVIAIVTSLAVRAAAGVPLPGRKTSQTGRSAAAPNVVLIVLDTVRADNLSLYGYARQTSPRLDRFARDAVVFERAFSASPWTLPSHAALFTGHRPGALSADWLTPLDGAYPTLADVFRNQGYDTAGFSGNLLYCTAATGLARGFTRFKDFPITPGALLTSSWLLRPIIDGIRRPDGNAEPLVDKRAADVNAEFAAWLEAAAGRPFFAFLNYFDAHRPYVAPPPYDTAYGDGGKLPDLLVRRTWSKQEIQRSLDAYDGELRYVDDQLGRLIDLLTSRDLLRNTLVVITSDHGEQFGEHGLFDHANSLYRQVLQVPLVIAFQGRLPSGVRVHDPVSLMDVAATILDVAGLAGEEPHVPGRSLAGHWSTTRSPSKSGAPLLAEVSKAINMPEWLPASKGAMKSVIVNGLHYIRHSDGREELYDMDQDIAEGTNLAGNPDARAALDGARQTLVSLFESGPRQED